MLVLSRFGQRRVVHASNDLFGYVGLVSVAVLSVAIAYFKVRGYT